MDFPANRPRVPRKKFWCQFVKRAARCQSHLVTISAKRFQQLLAKCPAFSCHFLPSMLCVPAPCAVLLCAFCMAIDRSLPGSQDHNAHIELSCLFGATIMSHVATLDNDVAIDN